MDQDFKEVSFYSDETRKFYKLKPTKTWPALVISGIWMHRTDKTDPQKDSNQKIKLLGKIYGIVLDTCTGLGYTAMLAARKDQVEQVITFERDENVIRIAKQNPFSKELFDNPKIKMVMKDVFEGIKEFPDRHFNFIIHDPPRFILSPEIYSLEFYKELKRVLKPNSRLLHYIGAPGSKSGKNYFRGISQRLRLAGFNVIKKFDDIGCLVCSQNVFKK